MQLWHPSVWLHAMKLHNTWCFMLLLSCCRSILSLLLMPPTPNDIWRMCRRLRNVGTLERLSVWHDNAGGEQEAAWHLAKAMVVAGSGQVWTCMPGAFRASQLCHPAFADARGGSVTPSGRHQRLCCAVLQRPDTRRDPADCDTSVVPTHSVLRSQPVTFPCNRWLSSADANVHPRVELTPGNCSGLRCYQLEGARCIAVQAACMLVLSI
jgi:hypothetical protein